MSEPTETPSPLMRVLKTGGLALLLIFIVGVIAGFLAGHIEDGTPLRTIDIAILAGLALASGGIAWLLVRTVRAQQEQEPLSPRERLNRNLINLSGLMGGAAALLVALSQGFGPETSPFEVFSSGPLPPLIAIILMVGIGVAVPILSFFWHRNAIDEQEADAYKTGALYGIYLFMIGAPLWWFAWRGGFVPEPNGVVIYLAVVTVVGVTWTWKKYR